MYVDDPRTMEGALRQSFVGAIIKMDMGHVIFSRIGPLLDKTHEQYCELLSLCNFTTHACLADVNCSNDAHMVMLAASAALC